MVLDRIESNSCGGIPFNNKAQDAEASAHYANGFLRRVVSKKKMKRPQF